MAHQLSHRACKLDGRDEQSWEPETMMDDVLAMLLLGDGDSDEDEGAAAGDCGVSGRHCESDCSDGSETSAKLPPGTQSEDAAGIEHEEKAPPFGIPSLLTRYPGRARLDFSSAFSDVDDDGAQQTEAPGPT